MLVDGVYIVKPCDMTEEEALEYLNMERAAYKEQGKQLGRLSIRVDGAEVELESREKSPIRRIRRITGYLSEMDNFNQSKKAELAARVQHAEG